jgi:hypothetical protein
VKWLKRLAAIVFWFALVYSAHAQSVIQSGNVTPTHFSCWTSGGVIQDCGSAFNPYASGIGAIGPVCSLSAGITGPYQQFCLQAGTSGGVLSIQNFGGAPAGGISFTINGSPATFPTVVTPTVNGNLAEFNNTTGTLIDSGIAASSIGTGTVSNCSTTGGITFYASTGTTVGCTAPLTWASSTGLTINPTVSTTNQGFNVTQSSAATTPTGPINFNIVNVTNAASVTLPATLTTGMSNNAVHGVLFQMTDTGGSTITSALTAHYIANSGSPNGDKIALHGNAYSSQTMTAYLLGLDAVSAVDAGANQGFLVAAQFEVGMYNAATATNRIGIEVSADTAGQGSTSDAAIAIDNLASPGGPWKKGISFGSVSTVGLPIDSSGDLFFTHDTMTITNVMNFANLTVTGSVINLPNFSVSNVNNQNATSSAALINTSAGTSAYAQFSAAQANGSMTVGVGGANATPALYTNRAYFTANSLAAVFGTNSSQPAIFAVNNAEVGRWSSATPGQLIAGLSGTTVGNLCTANATSGSICLAPPTGALGSAVLTLPDITDTLAGLTAPTFITSITAPIVYGGSAAGSSLSLVSTSNGSPSGDIISIKQGGNALVTLKGGNLGFGTETNPTAPFVFSQNTTTGQGSQVGGTFEQFQFIGPNGGNGTGVAIIGYGGLPSNFFYATLGTAASPTALTIGASIGSFGFIGYDGVTALSSASSSARILATAGQTFTNTNHGTYIEFDATVNGGSRAQAMRLQAGVIIGTGTTDPGAGQLAVTAMTQTSAAQSGTVCYSTSIGALTYDATLGCLTSLEELKNIHGPITNALAEVNALRPFWFSPINRPSGSDLAEQPGFGAHQVEAVDRRLVGYGQDGKLRGVRYMEMSALLAAAIQELKADNDNLRAEMEILKRKAK